METVRSRRDEYSDATRRALLDAATELFARDGFAATSLDTVATACRVTKGAVYHHFTGKRALFEEVLTESAQATCDAIVAAASRHTNVWDGASAGLDVFLARCQDPVYLRLCFQEGPAALGFTEWWAHGERYEMGLIGAMLAALKGAELLDVDDVEILTQLLFGSMTAAALSVARSDDRADIARRIKGVLTRVLEGLRPT
jgi:AcrR family transcriptional regulator